MPTNPWQGMLIPKHMLPESDIPYEYAEQSGAFNPSDARDPYPAIPQFNTPYASLVRTGMNPYLALKTGVILKPQAEIQRELRGALAYARPYLAAEDSQGLLPIGKEGEERMLNPTPAKPSGYMVLPRENSRNYALHEAGHLKDFADNAPLEKIPLIGPGHFTPGQDRRVMGPNAWNAMMQSLIKAEEEDRKEAKRRGLQSTLPDETKLSLRGARQKVRGRK